MCFTGNFWLIIFLRLSKVRNMLHHGSVDRIQYKECYIILSCTLLAFFIVHFYHFHFFFWWSIKFLQQNFTQELETENYDQKSSLELYVKCSLISRNSRFVWISRSWNFEQKTRSMHVIWENKDLANIKFILPDILKAQWFENSKH